MFNWLIKFLGGVPKKEVKALENRIKVVNEQLIPYITGQVNADEGILEIKKPITHFVIPCGIKVIRFDSYGLNNAPISVYIGVTPGKEYTLSSIRYTEDTTNRCAIISGTDAKTWYKEGTVLYGSSKTEYVPGAILWDKKYMNESKIDVEDY